MDDEARGEIQANNRLRMAQTRSELDDEARGEIQACDRDRKAKTHTKVKEKEAMKGMDIWKGNYTIQDLNDSADSIGEMNFLCPSGCGALKFKKETSSNCCQNGKVLLPALPDPPEELQSLWFDNTPNACLFRKHCRSINNAVCLTSIKVKERTFPGGFNPSVIFEGKVMQFSGPLQAQVGETPIFAQLYVHDPDLQVAQRFANMSLPGRMSQRQKDMLKQILKKVQNILHECNPFIQDFEQIVEIPDEELGQGYLVINAKVRPTGEHERRYNEQINLKEVSILTNCEPHDLVLNKRSGGVQKISDLNPKAMPLHFTLLFPFGTYGWDQHQKQTGGVRRITPREFAVFYLNKRNGEGQYLLRAGRLFQEWICMQWVTAENQKLQYQRNNQKALRADTYKNIKEITDERRQELVPLEDRMYPDDHKYPKVGRKILSSSYVGGPRWYNGQFQDAMAICREYHKPDYFITMTCNPHWPEILKELKQGETAQDRPDVVARVFKQKKDQMINDLIKGKILGKVVANMWVIEFQKRGLPHAHILIILADGDRPTTPEMVDSIVSAELPPDPEATNDPQVKENRQRLQMIVTTNMIHGPCGAANPQSPCMENGKCTKNFPKDFQAKTILDPDNSYPVYRRRSPNEGGRKMICQRTGREIDNRWVVPYSPFLSLRFNCHINIEICVSPTAAKYLYKYLTKGSDRAMVSAEVDRQGEEQAPKDEIREYEDLRSVGSSEATWHLMSYPIASKHPAVYALRIHLKDEQQVVFDEGCEEAALERQRETELTAFFNLNKTTREKSREQFDAKKMPTYVEMPKHYTYNKGEKTWKARVNDTHTIGRVHSVNPLAGDIFYLRMLLHHDHCRGKESHEDMLILANGKCCGTYQEVCQELGLLEDDKEWEKVLEEATHSALCPQIRALFITILIFCQPSNPRSLFDKFWEMWTDDINRKAQQKGITLDCTQQRTMVLLDLQLRLQSFEKDLRHFRLPEPTEEELANVETFTSNEPVIIREEKDFDVPELEAQAENVRQKFTDSQKEVYDTILKAVKEDSPLQLFIDARGGCGKTFVLNGVLDAVRTLEPGGCVALAMATTGISANLLHKGRTFHSRMKAPLNPTEESTLQISGQSGLAKLIRIAKILMIDEATMLHRFQLEAMDRSLRDLMSKPEEPFGGKIVILAGDFRQCLPVVPGASRAATVNASVNKSPLWAHFKILKLMENMRVKASGDSVLEQFDKWTLSLGNGSDGKDRIVLPESMTTEIEPNTEKEKWREGQSMKTFCNSVFPDLEQNINNASWLEGRAILTPTNKEVDEINDLMESKMSGEGLKLSSADTVDNKADAFRFNVEYMNTLQPNGFPRHNLTLKPGMPLMLLRNINPTEGLCNGTRLIFKKAINNKLLCCTVAGTDKQVLIPRITFRPKDGQYPFQWTRRQFPVRASFATTINKAQGQTLKFIGVWLRHPVFSHGQLYVAVSRVGSPSNLKIAIKFQDEKPVITTDNVVYREVLLPN